MLEFDESVVKANTPLTMSKEEFITSMCFTIRHDFGLTSEIGGLSDAEKKQIKSQMESIYQHHIEPLIKKIKELENV